MDWSKYKSLKSGSKVSFGKEKEIIKAAVVAVDGVDAVIYEEGDDIPSGSSVGDIKTPAVPPVPAKAKIEREYVAIAQKQWDFETGEPLDDIKREWTLQNLQSEKDRHDADLAEAKVQSDGLKAAIADFKKV